MQTGENLEVKCKRCDCSSETSMIQSMSVGLLNNLLCEFCFYDWSFYKLDLKEYLEDLELRTLSDYLMNTSSSSVSFEDLKSVAKQKTESSVALSKCFMSWVNKGAL